MSLLLFNDDPFDYVRPSRVRMGLEPEELLAPLVPRELRNILRCPAGYIRLWQSLASQQDAGSTVSYGKDRFEANLDVQQFKPEEISVKVNENVVTIEGKHEEKQDEHGYISRHFVRRYVLPKGHDVAKIESKLSSDGVLTITAPRIGDDKAETREVKVIQTGKPSKAIQNKEGKEQKKEE